MAVDGTKSLLAVVGAAASDGDCDLDYGAPPKAGKR